MDWQWKAFAITFGTVFVAELGDKTQIATLNFAAKGYPIVSVFLGAGLALLLSAFLGAGAGALAGHLINREVISNVAGVLFIAMGVLILFRVI